MYAKVPTLAQPRSDYNCSLVPRLLVGGVREKSLQSVMQLCSIVPSDNVHAATLLNVEEFTAVFTVSIVVCILKVTGIFIRRFGTLHNLCARKCTGLTSAEIQWCEQLMM